MDNEEVILTQEGYDKIEENLEELKTKVRDEIRERIKVALSYGDLSENSDKIAELENKLKHARIIDESEIDTKVVQIGNTVKVHDIEFDEDVTYTIVGSTEVDLLNNKISNESPIGQALLGAKKGQVVEAKAPNGIMKFKVLSITI